MDAVTLFMNQNSATIATLETETIPDMVKKDRITKEPNPWSGRVTKQSRVNGIVGAWNYTNSVNNQRVRESNAETVAEVEAVPEFTAEPRSWGERLPNTGLVKHGENYYVEIKVQRAIETTYMVDGRPATSEELSDIKRYLPQKTEGTRQEVEKPVILRDYKVDSIKSVRINGQNVEF